MTQPDLARISAALREVNAAQNSYSRALAEFRAVIPEGLLVLHKVPDREMYWVWSRNADDGLWNGCGTRDSFPEPGIIVEAPPPASEFLPRLSKPAEPKEQP